MDEADTAQAPPSTTPAPADWPARRSAKSGAVVPLAGLTWHSRQAELANTNPVEVIVLFGAPRYPGGRGSSPLFGLGASSLYDGPGCLLVDEVAESLSAVIELDDSDPPK